MAKDRVSHYLCIGCPLGCRLEVEEDEHGDLLEVRGWSCKKGDRYGRQEHTAPRRMVTTTVDASGATLPRLPVKTSEAVPKHLVIEVCRELRELTVPAPVSVGQVVLTNVAGTDADIVATRNLD